MPGRGSGAASRGGAMNSVPLDVARAAQAGHLAALKNLTRTIQLHATCSAEFRQPTPDEVASTYDFLPMNHADARHRAAAADQARVIAEADRRAAGIPADSPPQPKRDPFTFTELVRSIEDAAARLNEGHQADEHGLVSLFSPNTAKVAILAANLAGGTTAPTDAEILKVLDVRPHLRVAEPGDHPLPKGGHP